MTSLKNLFGQGTQKRDVNGKYSIMVEFEIKCGELVLSQEMIR